MIKLIYSSFFLLLLIFSFYLIACGGLGFNQRVMIHENDWLMCGGNPEQQNSSKTVLAPPFNLMWAYDCDAGIGNSALTVSDAVVFVNTSNGEMHTIDVSSGQRIGFLSFLGKDANSAPLLMQDKVVLAYAGDDKYSLACYNLLNRQTDWRINLGYLQTSPILYDNFIYVGSTDGKEYKIGITNGNIMWSFDTKAQIHSTCAIDGKKIVFGTDNGNIYCLNTDNGSEIWKYKTGGAVFSTPMIYNNSVYIGSYDSTYYAIGLDSGKIKWKNNLGTKIYSGSALYYQAPGKLGFESSVGAIIFGGIDGYLYSLDLIGGHINWKFQTNGVITCTPLVSGKYIFFTSYDWFAYCIDGNDGKLVWNYQLEGKGRTTPVIWNDFLFIPADKYVYCFTKNAVK